MRPWGGGSITSELRALVGANVPDLRGLFLRGLGGESIALGQTQIDTMRPTTGRIYTHGGAWDRSDFLGLCIPVVI